MIAIGIITITDAIPTSNEYQIIRSDKPFFLLPAYAGMAINLQIRATISARNDKGMKLISDRLNKSVKLIYDC